MRRLRLLTLVTLSFFCAVNLLAFNIQVGQDDIPPVKWGEIRSKISLTNTVDDYRFVRADCEVRYFDSSFSSYRLTSKYYIIEPLAAQDIFAIADVPGNFGPGLLRIKLYEVVDTLDWPVESQRFYSKEIPFNISIPAAVRPMIDSGLQVAPFMNRSDAFDNIFSRVLVLMIDRGKSFSEIASLYDTDTIFVKATARHLHDYNYLTKVGLNYLPNFIVVDGGRARKVKKLVESTVSVLYGKIIKNLPSFDSTLKEMVKAHLLTEDTNSVMDGGAVLYHHHAALLGPFLWDFLGKEFILDGERYTIFRTMNLCNPAMDEYMYMVMGKPVIKGQSFYYYLEDGLGKRFYTGEVPALKPCEFKERGQIMLPMEQSFGPDNPPTYYSYNAEKAKTPFMVLAEGTGDYINKLKKELGSLFSAKNELRFSRAVRYWCWNLVVSELMSKLEKSKVVVKKGSRAYIIELVDY